MTQPTILVATVPGACPVCQQDRRMWVYQAGRWTPVPCPHCTDATQLSEILERVE